MFPWLDPFRCSRAWNQQQSGGISGGGRIWPAAQVPAPWGSEIVAARVPQKVLQFAGIDDVFTSSRGSTKVLQIISLFVWVKGNCILPVLISWTRGCQFCSWLHICSVTVLRKLQPAQGAVNPPEMESPPSQQNITREWSMDCQCCSKGG
ncbi:uncharacterized protein LOC119365464 [Triticum dicoccoides]|uniref:uncharacterized protein LOC119365464 n=1 Tax=Triticum dicoccoides TaxID=85692 RepID=UPI00188E6A02|nr:uncharacterized protein LOC119365464 [Triticum dicoccoides]